MFYNEFEMLRLRLETLRDKVDCFVLVESPQTHSGAPKPLYFAERQAEFAEFPIRHVVADLSEYHDRLLAENMQRNAILLGLDDAQPQDIIMISDVDEIPDLSTWRGVSGTFSCRMFYYFMNVLHQNDWPGTAILRRYELGVPQDNRNAHWSMQRVGKGWHYSYLGGTEKVHDKVRAFCHGEYDTTDYHARFDVRWSQLRDIFDRSADPMPIVELEGPEWLLEHRAEFQHLIREPLSTTDLVWQAVTYAKRVPGLVSHDEMVWLAEQAVGCKKIIEVGSFLGRTAKLLSLASCGVVHTVDDYSQQRLAVGGDATSVRNQMRANLEQQLQNGSVVLHDCSSQRAAIHLEEAVGTAWADMIFIDGDHHGLVPEQDIRAYWPLLRAGGLLCGHDMHDEPVRRAVKKLLPDWLPGPNMLWYTHKESLNGLS
jgi:beta-1,4-mannosyl-glycoprotein beta-1,4-N-acetylglucosaminyltransferase